MRIILLILLLSTLGGCGEKKIPQVDSVAPQTYAISGTILKVRSGTTVVLKNNGGDDIEIPAGNETFSFSTKLATGSNYNISVVSQQMQTCKVSHGEGLVASADITDIVVECSSLAYDQLANAPANFSNVLLLDELFIVPASGKSKAGDSVDPTTECVNQIESKSTLRALNEKFKSEQLLDQPAATPLNLTLPGKTGRQIISFALDELTQCKSLGDAWRDETYFPAVVATVDKSYADLFALLTNLYDKKLNYSEYMKRNNALHNEFNASVNAAISQTVAQQQADAKKAKDLELEVAEKQRLDVIAKQTELETQKAEQLLLEELMRPAEEARKKLAEEARLAELAAQKEKEKLEAQRLKDEAQKLADEEARKIQALEDEKVFQSLHQRQQIDRLR